MEALQPAAVAWQSIRAARMGCGVTDWRQLAQFQTEDGIMQSECAAMQEFAAARGALVNALDKARWAPSARSC